MAAFCSGKDLLDRALELSEIPKEYREANLHHYVEDADNACFASEIKEALRNITDFVKAGINFAFINHRKGTGKSWSACALGNEFLYKSCVNPALFDYDNPLVLYVKFGNWANDIRRAHQIGDTDLFREIYKHIDMMKSVPLLILDDMGSGRITDVIRDITYDVVDKRKETGKSTVYTANFVDSILRSETILGEMVDSRMFYNTVFFPLEGRDRRKDRRN
jgi:DNA replication protein DnaC